MILDVVPASGIKRLKGPIDQESSHIKRESDTIFLLEKAIDINV